MKIILDTNALMMPFQFQINLDKELERIFGKIEVVVPSTVINELSALRRINNYAKTGLEFAKRYKTVYVEGNADDSILKLAKKENSYVLTNDLILKKRLKENGIKVVILRERGHLELEE